MRLVCVVLGLMALVGCGGELALATTTEQLDDQQPAAAELSTWRPRAAVSFTFDDGYSSVVSVAKPILAARGMKGTSYVITGQVGHPGHFSWNEALALQNAGWEIGSHSVTHPSLPYLATSDIAAELQNSAADLRAHGLKVSTFAAPYGEYDLRVLAEAARNYSAFRPFDDAPQNVWPYQRLLVQVKTVQTGVSLADVRSWLDEAQRSQTWLVLVFHDIVESPADRGDWGTTKVDLAAIADDVHQRGLPVVTIAKVFERTTKAPVLSQDFATGLSGFTTDAPDFVAVENDNHGALPTPLSSVRLSTGRGQNVHLFSPHFRVASSKTYVIESFVSTAEATGAVGIYVDEYNAAGGWVSGQYLHDAASASVTMPALRYQPSSPAVRAASLQFIWPASATGHAFVDSIRVDQAY